MTAAARAIVEPRRTQCALASPFAPLKTRDLLSVAELSATEIHALLDTAVETKADPVSVQGALRGKAVVMLFEKPSLRTRVSFEVGVGKMGGSAVYFDHASTRIGEREPVSDYGANLSLWCDAIVARVFDHSVVEGLAQSASVPVINALSDLYHPCQALADVQTLRERFGDLRGLPVAFVGDGNNVCASLMIAAATLGMDMTVVAPPGYEPDSRAMALAAARLGESGGQLRVTGDLEGVRGAAAVYTDTWVSMGQGAEAAQRRSALQALRVTEDVMTLAGPDAVFMHCLPAHRGEEVTAEVIDGPRSVVLQQAENRMHAQNALLLHVLTN